MRQARKEKKSQLKVHDHDEGPDLDDENDVRDEGLDSVRSGSELKKEKLVRLAGDAFEAKDDPTPVSLISIQPMDRVEIGQVLDQTNEGQRESGPSTVEELQQELKNEKAQRRLW